MIVSNGSVLSREEILEAARIAYTTYGFSATNVSRILYIANPDLESKDVFYEHFSSERAIYREIVNIYAEPYTKDVTFKKLLKISQETLESYFVRLFLSMCRFFIDCHTYSSDSYSYHDSFIDDVIKHTISKTEETFKLLLANAPWRSDSYNTEMLTKMSCGAFRSIATKLWMRRRAEPLGIPLDRMSLEVCERIMLMCEFPNSARARIMKTLRWNYNELVRESMILVEEGTGKVYDTNSILEFMRGLSVQADIVRLVDPEKCVILQIGVDGKFTLVGRCHGVWLRRKRCENCISRDCVRLNRRYDKYELIDGQIYQIASYPVVILTRRGREKKCAVECVRIISKGDWYTVIEDQSIIKDLLRDE